MEYGFDHNVSSVINNTHRCKQVASLTEPHTSRTVLQTCVCVCLSVCFRPYNVNVAFNKALNVERPHVLSRQNLQPECSRQLEAKMSEVEAHMATCLWFVQLQAFNSRLDVNYGQ